MKNTPFALFLVLGVFFISPVTAEASLIFENLNTDNAYAIVDGATGGASNAVYQTLTAQETGTIDNFRFYGARNTSGSVKTLLVDIYDNSGGFICRLANMSSGGGATSTAYFNEIPTGTVGSTVLLSYDTATAIFFPCDGVTVTAGTPYRIQIDYSVTGSSQDGEFYTLGTSPNNFYFEASDGDLPPVWDGAEHTHVMNTNTPVTFSTTTSPVLIDFDYIINEDDVGTANGYNIYVRNTLSYKQYSFNKTLPDTTEGRHNATTTIDIEGDGTWKMDIAITDWSESTPGQSTYFYPQLTPVISSSNYGHTYFGLSFNDNYTVSSSTGVFSHYASTSCAINFLGTFNLQDCIGYLAVPTNNVALTYQAIPSEIGTKLPFSYFFSVAQTWETLTVESTDASPTYTYDFADLGIGSTTPMGNILPNMTVFSASTTESYFPSGTFDLLKQLAQIAIILTFFGYMFFEIRNLIRT